MLRRLTVAMSLPLVAAWGMAQAAGYPMPGRGESLVGGLRQISTVAADTFVELARKHGVGYQELVLANPGVDRWLPGDGAEVLLPTRHILPNTPREGIVVNVAEMRLYYYAPKTAKSPAMVYTWPVGVGRDDWKTPEMKTWVGIKETDPAWNPTPGIIAEYAKRGEKLARYVPPGPNNPLGRHVLKLAIGGGYFIHGTPKRFGIGMPVTHGCVRMYADDIASLYEMVSVKTPVRIVNQPVKTAWQDGVLYVEVHADVNDNDPVDFDLLVDTLQEAARDRPGYAIDWDWVDGVALQPRGIPMPVNVVRNPRG